MKKDKGVRHTSRMQLDWHSIDIYPRKINTHNIVCAFFWSLEASKQGSLEAIVKGGSQRKPIHKRSYMQRSPLMKLLMYGPLGP